MSAPGPDPEPAAPDAAEPDPAAGSSLGPLLQTLQDPGAPPGELTDAHLTIVSRFTGEGGKAFIADVRRHFPQLCKVFKTHISSPNLELSNAALQALGFCTFNSNNTAELSDTEIQELLAAVNSVALKSSDKNTRTRALWVISKQAFPPDIVQKEVSNILSTLEAVLTKGEVQSVVVEYEALNVIIRLVEQTPARMGEEAVRWARLVLPLVVHSAHKVQLRGATALEMGMPLLLHKQQEVAAVTEHLMTTKLISELQKLFSAKSETFVLKLWPLFVRLLGKTLHRSGSFINSLLQLEELGFRSGSPVVKKIAFIAWKSLIDNFALNPDILCSAKRLKLLMQPLSSIHVRTEALALTKLEVWWYLLVRLGAHLPSNFEQVCVPLIQSTLSVDPAAFPGTPSRPSNPNLGSATPGQKPGAFPFSSPGTPRLAASSSSPACVGQLQFPSIQLLAMEMLLHFLRGPRVLEFAKENKLLLSLEPLQSPLISSPSFFCKHASTLISAVQDGFVAIGKEVPDCLLNVIWKDMNGFVKTAIEAGNKKEKQGSEILTMLLQALKNTVRSNSLPVPKVLSLIEITAKELPPKVLGSPAYQVADMDLLNGTPALFLIQLLFHTDLLDCSVTDERFFGILESLVGFALSGPSSALAFSDSVLCVVDQSARQVSSKEHLCRMWSIVVNPLTEWINQNNEVNQGDALEHNFSAVYSALLLPVFHIFPAQGFPQPMLKSLLRSWSELYRAFARCAALVTTAEENLCCEELCAKIISGLEGETPVAFPMLEGLTHLVSVMVDCINFAPYGTKFQPKNRSPQTPTDWARKKKEPLGKLSSVLQLLLLLLRSFHDLSAQERLCEPLGALAAVLLAALHALLSRIALPSLLGAALGVLAEPLALFYERSRLPEVPKVYSNLNNKLEKLLAEILQCLQCHCPGSCDSELLQQLSPVLCVAFQHRNKQLRQQSAQLWNCTFAKASSLTYPQELKSVLSQAKKKIPLLLPGFESVEMSEECSGPFSEMMENSQLDAQISGMEVNVGQKRDSILAQTNEPKIDGKDKCSSVQATPAKLKLEFSSPKTTSETLLEEEKSVDFVFIPPETKPRILTEHQKEVLRSKRADIPAMYNNLDASQDTSSFSQYTQSQEDSLEVSPLVENAQEEPADQAQEEEAGSEGCHSQESPARSSEGETKNDTAEMIPEESSLGEGLETSSVEAASQEAPEEKEDTSNVTSSSASSDIISGTPQPVSRRQSFITLEKFETAESRPFSPAPLSSVPELPGAAPEAAPQENTAGSTAKAEEPGEENKTTPQCERRVTRQQSRMKQGSKSELQGSKSELQGNKSEQQGSKSEQQGSKSKLQGNKSELQGNKSELQGNKSEQQGNKSEQQGNKSELQGNKSKQQGNKSELQGNKSELQGNKSKLQGSKSELQGSKSKLQGNKSEQQGSKSELQGNKLEQQGSKSEQQGSKSELQGSKSEQQGNKSEQQGSKSEQQGSKSEQQGSKSKLQGNKSKLQGNKSEQQGNKSEQQGSKSELQGSKSKLQGNKSEQQGNKSELQGSKSELQGSKSELQGSKSELQGSKSELQGNKSELQGSKSELQGNKSEQQGNKSEQQGNKSEQQGNKSELQGNKSELPENKSELQGRTEESLASDSLEGSAELGSAVEDVLSQSQALPSSQPDVHKTEDAAPEVGKTQELDMDSKENTPPDSSSCSEQVPGDESQVPAVSPHEKQLRRSARRRSENVESSGSQEKEDVLPKRDRRKEEEKEDVLTKRDRRKEEEKEDVLSKRDRRKEDKEDGLPKRDRKKEEEKEDGLPKRDRRKEEEKEDGLTKRDRRKEEEKEDVLPKRDRKKEEEKEDVLLKRDRRKEAEKAGQKKLSQGKGDGSQKQKGIAGKTTESTKESSQAERVAEDWSSKDSAACRGLDEEGSRGGSRAEDSPRPEGEAQGSLSTAGQKVERPRYHTRRSSQGLLSSIENSEGDSSEGKEESAKRRKTIKTRSRSNSLEGKLKEGQAGSQSIEESPQENGAKNPVEENKGDAGDAEVSIDAAVPAEPGLERQEIPAAAGEAEGARSSENSGALQDTSVEQDKGDASMESLSSPCLSEQDGGAAEESKQEEKQSSPGDCAAANASGAEPSPLQSHECHSKKSKRLKKIKSCDCCFKKLKQQLAETKVTELKEKAELEEAGSSPVQTPENVSGHSDLEESLALAPCGMSTPVHPPKEPSTFSLDSQGMALENLEGTSMVVEEENPENPEGSAAESTECMEEMKEPAEEKEQTEQVLPESVPGEPRESCLDSGDQGEEPAAAEPAVKEEISENGQMEEVPEELSVDSKPEEKEMKEEIEGQQEVKEEAETSAVETSVPDEEMKDELVKTEIKVPENVALANMSVDSPLKVEGGPQVQVAESPTSLQARCTWSPSASPSTSILKRGVKRSQEDDSLSPANKIRRVSFANPIFQEGLADDIDRRSPVIRSHSSPSSRSLKILSNTQHITTPTKGFLSPGSRTLKFKSSKKCLITEIAKESLPCLSEFVYPALAGCKAPVDVILPQITSNICARGLGQLIRAKNIKTVGDLSTLTALEIKTLPIRSPKVSNVKRALRGYHEQQVKSRALEESSVLEDAEKSGNDVEEKPLGGDEEKLAADLAETPASSEQPPVDLPGQIQALAAQLSSEDLHSYSGRQLFEMQEQLAGMASCILRNLQARWHSPPHQGPE